MTVKEKSELIKEAYLRYPIGTKFVSVCDNNTIREVKEYTNKSLAVPKPIKYSFDSDGSENIRSAMFCDGEKLVSNPCVYANGKWMDIVKDVKDLTQGQIMFEAKKRYTPGTHGISCYGHNFEIISPVFNFQSDGDLTASSVIGATGVTVFSKGEWAKITYVPCIPTETKKQKVVREAKEKGYTKGVKFIDLVHNCEFTIASDNAYDNFYDDEQLYIAVEENQFKNKSARIYKKGVWAEIVNPKTVLPEKWCVKINKENVDLIQLFIHKNCKNYNGYHDGWVARVGNYFYFPQEENTTGHSRGYVSFGYTEITTEQFKQNEKMEKTFGINRNQFAQIYDIACNKWKGLISEMVEENLGLFKSDCQLPESKVKEMFDASTPEQKEVLKRIFPMYKRQLTLEELKGKGKYFSETNDTYAPLLGIRGGGEYEKFAFGLNKDFNWELKVDSHGVKCLIPTKK